jgi:SAM-dependent methyltransferase
MQRLGWQVNGVELSPQATAHARNVLGLDVRQGSLEEAGYPDAHFDVVTLWHVLEHLPSPRRTLVEVKRVLKPGGTLICEVPNEHSLQSRLLGKHWFHLDPPRHLYAFSPTTLRRVVRAAGLAVLRIVQVPDLVGWSESPLTVWPILDGCRWPFRLSLAPWEFAAVGLGYGAYLWGMAVKNNKVQLP